MRKPLFVTTATLICSLTLTGCGDKPSHAVTGDQLDALIEQMGQIDTPDAALPDNKQLYTTGATVGGVEVPGRLTRQAAQVDQALALLPAAQQIAQNGSEMQKQAANAIIAGIVADEAAYLIGVSQADYQHLASQVGDLRHVSDLVADINQTTAELSGDRRDIIQTIQTGDTGVGESIDGIDPLQEQAEQAAATAADAKAKLAEITSKIESLRDAVAEYELIAFEAENEALGAQGATRFEKLDESVTAEYEAQLAAAKAEQLELDAKIAEGQADLADGRRERNLAVIADLEAKIQAVKQEQQFVQGQLDRLDSIRADTVKTLSTEFNRLDTLIQAIGFDRMAQAANKLQQADQAIIDAGQQGDLEHMSIYTLRARALQQQAVAARGYAVTLESLAAAGPDVLGAGLHGSLTSRIADMDTLQKSVAADAEQLESDAGLVLDVLLNSFEADSDEGKIAAEQGRVFNALLGSI